MSTPMKRIRCDSCGDLAPLRKMLRDRDDQIQCQACAAQAEAAPPPRPRQEIQAWPE